MKLACIGPEGTFSEDAALTGCPEANLILVEGADAFQKIFALVASGECDRGLVPFYNLISGRSSDDFRKVYHSLFDSRAQVVEVINHPIEWCAVSHSELDQVRVAYCFGQAEKQCSKFLKPYSGRWEIRSATSTAAAARAANDDRYGIALSSARAAERYGVPVRARNIQNEPDNRTWFYVIEKSPHRIHTGECCTLVVSPESIPLSQVSGPTLMAGQLVVPIRDRWSAKTPPGSQKPTLEFHEIPAPSNSSLVQEVSKFLKRLRGDCSIAGCYAKYDLEAMVCGTKCEKS